ncbi:ABC transporter ATP-binding protein [Natranaeroarchaeum aerophilus]|uniref:ABC transporter ATP-binding protein n=1 Tax=Natranaeroarchaeum aerophilus TaxID=2917711 RepID=A0AAE3FSA8_9EURY|nr:ABC transporter ATP-binding protein [Natranaeroarchaeum aerophilus]MCL9814145.1 ABC transporter ATP-binding protein [Natranaeroarchaeum aerophilus]
MAAIKLDGLTKDYGDVLANDDLSFEVETGEIFGYLGPNGAGKTTTIRALLGFISPTSGSARVLGYDVTDEPALIEAKRRIGYLSDEPGFDEDATGTKILDLHAAVKGDERRDELLDLFEPPLDRPVRDYSRGNVQKLGIVTTFMHDPDLVVLDEPTSGLDPLLQQRFAEFLRAEQRNGVTVFFSSHVLSEVRRLCDRVGIIRDGQLAAVEPIDSLLERTGKSVTVNTNEPIPTDALDVDGIHDPEFGEFDGDQSDTFTECTFTFTGDINALMTRLGRYDLLDLSIEEAPLEDVFLKFYGES